MSLRLRLFLLLGSLLLVLVGAEWWLLRTLTRDVALEVTGVASAVGQDVVRLIARSEAPVSHFSFQGADGKVPMKVVEESRVVESPGPDGKPKRMLVTRVEVGTAPRLRVVPEGGDETAPTKAGARFLFLEGPHVASRIPIPVGGLGEVMGRFRNRLLLGSLGILGLGILAAALVADRVAAPLRDLARASRRLADGTRGVTIVRSATGEAGEAIAAFNQMSGRLEALEREALAVKERQHLMELGEVARGLAHTLRNPLHALGLSVDELAARAGEDPDVEELSSSARRQIRRVDDSIRSFLSLASGTAGVVEPVSLPAVVEDVALSALQDARGRVRVDLVGTGEGVTVDGIAAELRAVVQALVVNAIEASPDGAAVAVSVARREGGGAVVTVEDDGPGLAPEVRGRLFLPHVTTKATGSGMGLFISHRIATTRYGGTVTLEDRSPRGTRAVVTFARRNGGRDA